MTGYPGYIAPARMTVAGINPDWTRGEFIAWLAGRLGWRRGVEIGVSFGDTLRVLLAAGLEMTGVDTWALNPGAPEPGDWTAEHHAKAWESAQAVQAAYAERCTLLRGHSPDLAAGQGPFDFVWIDGDHATDACTADIAAWLPTLKPGGWILGHDINWPTVRAAVDAAVPGYLVGPDSVWFRPVHPVPGWWAEVVG